MQNKNLIAHTKGGLKPGVQKAGSGIISSVKYAPDAASSLADLIMQRDMRFVLAAERSFFLR